MALNVWLATHHQSESSPPVFAGCTVSLFYFSGFRCPTLIFLLGLELPTAWDPEVRGPLSLETDVWGFGCSIVEMLSGVQPWFEKSIPEIYQSVVIKKEKPRIPEVLPVFVFAWINTTAVSMLLYFLLFELHCEPYYVGQFVRFKATVLSPRFEWPQSMVQRKNFRNTPKWCLVVEFPAHHIGINARLKKNRPNSQDGPSRNSGLEEDGLVVPPGN
ncbi:hypothetical protein V6N13_078889 [Hibiscus sabdariffa]